ncbi:hypothetical protein [Fusibacter sp. 3D3]|uniref:hypothetical protein n=1 Tax=Fusibacter sp. 3D3 TaxID=1048380 RepID=UPI000853E0E7|nr:hypothetical protein [Fusibacter sp. 3D3]GAU76343.1 hypothetical protein F3D3_0940 [Fusibacter sp. 3D3]
MALGTGIIMLVFIGMLINLIIKKIQNKQVSEQFIKNMWILYFAVAVGLSFVDDISLESLVFLFYLVGFSIVFKMILQIRTNQFDVRYFYGWLGLSISSLIIGMIYYTNFDLLDNVMGDLYGFTVQLTLIQIFLMKKQNEYGKGLIKGCYGLYLAIGLYFILAPPLDMISFIIGIVIALGLGYLIYKVMNKKYIRAYVNPVKLDDILEQS